MPERTCVAACGVASAGPSDAGGNASVAVPDWAKELNCSITVCDADGVIVYMNDMAVRQYARRGDLIGKNLFDCHGARSAAIIRDLLRSGGTNSYTVEKAGLHKMVFQSAWKRDGVVCGLCEISMAIPASLSHHVRG